MPVMVNGKEMYKIGEFAEILNVSIKTLQRWDKNGSLVAVRGHGSVPKRYYDDSHIQAYKDMIENNPNKLSRKKCFKYDDLTNNKYGKLTVLKRSDDWIGSNGHRHITWLCQCECGATKVIKGASLKAGYNKSCGCSQYGSGIVKNMWDEYKALNPKMVLDNVQLNIKEPLKPPKVKRKGSNQLDNIKGKSFGWWVVLERGNDRYYANGAKVTTWICQCKCGQKKEVPARDLKRGVSKSCGCMTSISWLEEYVKIYLSQNGFKYIYQKSFSDLKGTGGKPLSYDFVVYDDNHNIICLIECQGEQHYKPVKRFGGSKQFLIQQIHDKLKQLYANDILKKPLLEVPYTFRTSDAISNFLKENII